MYYKFRNFKNYKYLLDIFLNQRLYASSFRNLNDNFEGQFYCSVFEGIKRYRLNPIKQTHLSICSFSEYYDSHLMWSHYADGHRGFVIGFDIDQSEFKTEKVKYDGLISFKDFPYKYSDIKNVFFK